MVSAVAKSQSMQDTGQFTIGIDTGGTYTDAVVYCRAKEEVVAKAKVPTTHDDLSRCVIEALSEIFTSSAIPSSDVCLLSVSTTLATNALVEGGGRPAGLVTIGLEEAITTRRGLDHLIPANPILQVPGGHSSHGTELESLDLSQLNDWLVSQDPGLEAYAVVGSFSVRNPEHELTTARTITEITGKSVTLSHELSGQLDAPKRAVTALLNARLVPLIHRLVAAVESSMDHLGISCPLMVMRGDGSLVSSDFVKARPIETILSGPAASATGAAALNSITEGMVVDIGGTTTDVAAISGGQPQSAPTGANIGGHETMVNAVRVHTAGIGGDSHVQTSPLDDHPISIGPRRVNPLVSACSERPEVQAMLEDQLGRPVARESDGIYLWLLEQEPHWTPQSSAEATIIAGLKESNEGRRYEEVVTSGLERNALNRLIASGLVGVAAFTPTDAAHVLGVDNRYDAQPAHLGSDLLARQLDRFGEPLADSGSSFAELVLNQLSARISETILTAAADHDELPVAQLKSALQAQAHLENRRGGRRILGISAAIGETLTAVGAPAALHHSHIALNLDTDCVVPEHSEVANAYGAATGMIRLVKETIVSAPRRGLFRVHVGDPSNHYDLQRAQEFAERDATEVLTEKMEAAGAEEFVVSHVWKINDARGEERQLFVEAILKSVAVGSPI